MKKIFVAAILAVIFSAVAGFGYALAECDTVAYLDSLGGSAKSHPVMRQFNGKFIIVVRGQDDKIWAREWNNAPLTDWYQINEGTTAGNLRLEIENGNLIIYAQGVNGFVYKARYENQQQWAAWQSTGRTNAEFGANGSDVSNGYKAYTFGSNQIIKIGKCVVPFTPDWAKNLIIYEIATKEFTSPGGPETGNFKSLKDKMRYLSDLGITGIWLTGSSLSDPHYFGNIWTQYASVRPDKIDPSLGTEQDFKNMIDEAHRHNIKIFLDVIDHAVVNNSSLIQEHPSWFRDDENPWRWRENDHSCLWKMKDYDWNGDQPELEKWWIDIWTKYVTDYGIDGYRIDLGSMREDLWASVKENAKKSGHPIVVFEEGGAGPDDRGWLHGTYDFWQTGTFTLGDMDRNGNPYSADYRTFTNPECIKRGCYLAEVKYNDGGSFRIQIPKEKNNASFKSLEEITGFYRGKTLDKVGRNSLSPDGIADHEIDLVGVNASKTISSIVIEDLFIRGNVDGAWNSLGDGKWYVFYERLGDTIRIFFSPFDRQSELNLYSGLKFNTVMISCHDWTDYSVKGSKYKFGYGAMFTPLLPLFMAGEEFDNPYNEVPNKKGRSVVFGWQSCGYANCGPWLYASQLQWNYLDTASNKNIYNEFKKIISIRKNSAALSHIAPSLAQANIMAINNFSSNIDVPALPYIRWVNNEVVLVVGNSNKSAPLSIKLNLSSTISKAGFSGKKYYKIKDLWTENEKIMAESELASFDLLVDPDNFKIFQITAYSGSVCAAGHVSGCKVCKSDGSGWADDNSKCAAGQVCSSGNCISKEGCVPKTCADLGNYQCGSWSDGCGNTLNCGTCAGGKTCNASGQCVLQTTGGPVVESEQKQQIQQEEPTRAEIIAKIAEIKKLLIQLIIQLIAELQKQLAAAK